MISSMKPVALKNDRYRKARGGYSRLLVVSCQKCGAAVCRYQKDGPGILKRMYVDRISDPSVSLAAKELRCPEGHVLGVATIYEKEDRPAFRLFVDAVTKKIVKK